jgi:hypothetical protein
MHRHEDPKVEASGNVLRFEGCSDQELSKIGKSGTPFSSTPARC